jgi:GTP-binding protein
MFIDSVVVSAQAGAGGHGMIAFRREKHVPKGGPSGGDGGRGGDVIVVCDAQAATLLDLRYRRHYKGGRGAHGSGSQKAGRSGEDVEIRVPVGTLVFDDETGETLADLVTPEERIVLCRGGRGGRGNAAFASPIMRSPRTAEDGRPGEVRRLRFELKVMADVGLVGRPNAGKSTLLSAVSAARPKIAAYPFTTREPHLGIVKAGDYASFVLADIPGLIEGAHEGRGLGHQFLRHIQRARVLVFLIDITEPDPAAVLAELASELERFDPTLLSRPRVLTLSKADLCPDADEREAVRARFTEPPLVISAVTGLGLDAWIRHVHASHRSELRRQADQRAGDQT